MTKIENIILDKLYENARIDLNDLAIMLDISSVELANIIEDMKKRKIICGYQAVINWDNTDREIVTALIEVKVTPQRGLGYDKIAERIYNFEEVDSIYLMSGGYDFMILIEGKSMREISRFVFEKLATLDMVNSTATHFVLKRYKDHGVKLVDSKKESRMIVSA